MTTTCASHGRTPVLLHQLSPTLIAMSAAPAYRPNGTQATQLLQPKHSSDNTESLIKSVPDQHDQLDGDPVTPIWGGLSTHQPKAIKAWMTTRRHWAVAARLPAYAPEPSPVEPASDNVKATQPANFCPNAIDQPDTSTETGLESISNSYQLCFPFLDRTGLPN
ncbi:IS630 family transposase [Saccharopolyspora spinosa]|uniref:IS630 family transposase n=1 Tax=Saccharopolyspora spinosa TaxID=60894 RepID=UPI001EEE766D|nr:IS630 family transposase [Saccharopolyspora spinosa]